jgi:hypothetical protein
MQPHEIAGRLEYLRGEIEHERISYSEIVELQALAPYINETDTQLLEWATPCMGDLDENGDVSAWG